MRSIGAIAGIALATACVPTRVALDEGPREYVAEDYEQVLHDWTRSERLFVMSELDEPLAVTATFEAWDFRWAYVVRYADDYRLTTDQRRGLLDRSLADSRRHHQFYVALYAERHKWADLTADEPAWIVRLVDSRGNETAPIEIEAIKRPGAIERTYFPYTSPWRSAFRVKFPTERKDGRPTIAPDAEWIGLRFAGAQGHRNLVWDLGPKG